MRQLVITPALSPALSPAERGSVTTVLAASFSAVAVAAFSLCCPGRGANRGAACLQAAADWFSLSSGERAGVRADSSLTHDPIYFEHVLSYLRAAWPLPGLALSKDFFCGGTSMPSASHKSISCSCSSTMMSRKVSLSANSPMASAWRMRWR